MWFKRGCPKTSCPRLKTTNRFDLATKRVQTNHSTPQKITAHLWYNIKNEHI
jgi:hypothetical protein